MVLDGNDGIPELTAVTGSDEKLGGDTGGTTA